MYPKCDNNLKIYRSRCTCDGYEWWCGKTLGRKKGTAKR